MMKYNKLNHYSLWKALIITKDHLTKLIQFQMK
jgi:hypothetical protein